MNKMITIEKQPYFFQYSIITVLRCFIVFMQTYAFFAKILSFSKKLRLNAINN